MYTNPIFSPSPPSSLSLSSPPSPSPLSLPLSPLSPSLSLPLSLPSLPPLSLSPSLPPSLPLPSLPPSLPPLPLSLPPSLPLSLSPPRQVRISRMPVRTAESLLSLACSAGYYELAEVLLRMRASVEDRGVKGELFTLVELSHDLVIVM